MSKSTPINKDTTTVHCVINADYGVLFESSRLPIFWNKSVASDLAKKFKGASVMDIEIKRFEKLGETETVELLQENLRLHKETVAWALTEINHILMMEIDSDEATEIREKVTEYRSLLMIDEA